MHVNEIETKENYKINITRDKQVTTTETLNISTRDACSPCFLFLFLE